MYVETFDNRLNDSSKAFTFCRLSEVLILCRDCDIFSFMQSIAC